MLSRKRIVWTYWFVTAILLTACFAGIWPGAVLAVVGLSAVQAVHFLHYEKRPMAFPVQLRIAYTLWTAAGLWSPLFFLHWIQFAGTWAVVTTGYCPLARMLVLLPWNRAEKLSPLFVWTLFTTPPVEGSIRDQLVRPA
jgi:hypothetical protein